MVPVYYLLLNLRKLENEAKALPNQTPAFLMVNKLNYFLLDCAINPQMAETYERTRSVFDWAESTANYINYVYDLFKISQMSILTQQRYRKLTLAHQWNVSNESQSQSIPRMESFTLQTKVMEAFLDSVNNTKNRMVKSPDQPSNEYRVVCNILERSVLSAIIEIKFFANLKTRTSDGQPVCMQKVLLLLNSGFFEYIHINAPHEEWHYEEVPGISNRKQVDLNVQSRFELYQNLTIYGNIMLNMMQMQATNNLGKLFSMLLQQFARLATIDHPCPRCRHRLRDFTTVVDYMSKAPAHRSCK